MERVSQQCLEPSSHSRHLHRSAVFHRHQTAARPKRSGASKRFSFFPDRWWCPSTQAPIVQEKRRVRLTMTSLAPVVPNSTAFSILHRLHSLKIESKRNGRWTLGVSMKEESDGVSGLRLSMESFPWKAKGPKISEEEATILVKERGSLLTRIGRLEEHIVKLEKRMQGARQARGGNMFTLEKKVHEEEEEKEKNKYHPAKNSQSYFLLPPSKGGGFIPAATTEKEVGGKSKIDMMEEPKEGMKVSTLKKRPKLSSSHAHAKSNTKSPPDVQVDCERVFSLQGIQTFSSWEFQHAQFPLESDDQI